MADIGTIDQISRLSPLAAEYGPFFFALLFTLVVPFLGQSLIKRNIAALENPKPAELKERLAAQRQYRVFGIAMSAFLVVFSVFWWGAVQIWPPATSKVAMQRQIDRTVSQRIFEGVIMGGNDDDTFIDYSPPRGRYRSYVFPQRDRTPMLIRFVVVFDDVPEADEQVQFFYASKATLDAMRQGYIPKPLTFCLNKQSATLSLVRTISGPSIQSNCKPPPK